MSWSEKLKTKWELKSDLQLTLVLITFTLAGSSIVFVRRPIFDLIGINEDTSLWVVIPLYIVIIVPCYQILLMFWGTILGQWAFVVRFEKKMLRRMRIIKN